MIKDMDLFERVAIGVLAVLLIFVFIMLGASVNYTIKKNRFIKECLLADENITVGDCKNGFLREWQLRKEKPND